MQRSEGDSVRLFLKVSFVIVAIVLAVQAVQHPQTAGDWIGKVWNAAEDAAANIAE